MPAARLLPALLLALVAALVSGCGDDDARGTATGTEATAPRTVRVVLDFVPNAVHAGLYAARERGLDERHGVRLDLQPPGATSDTLKLVATGAVPFGIADLIDVALARERGLPLVAVAAVVQRPTGAVLTLASGDVRRPADLEGRRVGLTGVPSDPAIVRSVVRADGGDPGRVEEVVIGFNAVPALVAGTVDAAIGFWPADGVQLEASGHPVRAFRLDDHGAPPFPELVLFTRDALRDDDPTLVADVVAAARAGYDVALADPEGALADLRRGAEGVDADLASAQLRAYSTILVDEGRPWGDIDPDAVEAFARWLEDTGVAAGPVDAGRLARPPA